MALLLLASSDVPPISCAAVAPPVAVLISADDGPGVLAVARESLLWCPWCCGRHCYCRRPYCCLQAFCYWCLHRFWHPCCCWHPPADPAVSFCCCRACCWCILTAVVPSLDSPLMSLLLLPSLLLLSSLIPRILSISQHTS